VSGRLLFPRSFNPECKPLVEKLLLREIQNRLGEWREREWRVREWRVREWREGGVNGIKEWWYRGIEG
jgi:hypothetical protein